MSQLFLQHEGEWIRLLGPNHRGFTEYLKYSVKPQSVRRYDISSRSWMVHYSAIFNVVSIARKYFQHIDWSTLPVEWQMQIAGAAAVEKLTEPPTENPYALLYVTDDAPMEVVRAAYKVLAMSHHPDVGGSAEKFQQLSNAFNQIKKQREH